MCTAALCDVVMCDVTVGHDEPSKQFLQNSMQLVADALAHSVRVVDRQQQQQQQQRSAASPPMNRTNNKAECTHLFVADTIRDENEIMISVLKQRRTAS